jgi:hypothetical protein
MVKVASPLSLSVSGKFVILSGQVANIFKCKGITKVAKALVIELCTNLPHFLLAILKVIR